MTHQMFLYVSSDTCQEIYPGNSSTHFRVKLPKPIKLKNFGEWSIALMDIDIPKLAEDYKPKFFVIHSSLCTPTVFQASLKPVLHRLFYTQIKTGRPLTIDNPRYVPLNTKSLDIIDLYITDDQGLTPSFRPGSSTCTLHLSKTEPSIHTF